MATSYKNFLIELYREYLEEASFLYIQRLALLDDPHFGWRDLAGLEERLEPHLDGLVVGGDLALEVCRQHAAEGDAGELHAALRVFCRHKRKDLAFAAMEGLPPEDGEKIEAACAALACELPEEWQDEFRDLLRGGPPQTTAIVAKVLGHRRVPVGVVLHQLLWQKKLSPVSQVLWALGRLKEKSAEEMLIQHMLSADGAASLNAALALLRVASHPPVERLATLVDTRPWLAIAMAVGGARSSLPALLEACAADVTPVGLIALGVFGDIAAVDIILAQLGNKEVAGTAVISLNLLTGADLYVEEFIAEEVDEIELFEDELASYQGGQLPLRPDGKPYGVNVTRLTRRAEDWTAWWGGNSSRFLPGVRYRKGKPFSLTCLLENLESDGTPYLLRQLAYEELVIRYGADFYFEADMPIPQQLKVLQEISTWIGSNSQRFKEGAWYFGGRGLP